MEKNKFGSISLRSSSVLTHWMGTSIWDGETCLDCKSKSGTSCLTHFWPLVCTGEPILTIDQKKTWPPKARRYRDLWFKRLWLIRKDLEIVRFPISLNRRATHALHSDQDTIMVRNKPYLGGHKHPEAPGQGGGTWPGDNEKRSSTSKLDTNRLQASSQKGEDIIQCIEYNAYNNMLRIQCIEYNT